jgi:hypothetical protein
MEYLLIYIPVALLLLGFFWIRNIILYKKNYSSGSGIFNTEMVRMYNIFNRTPFEVSHNLFNFSASLITKFVGFTIFSTAILALCYNEIYFIALIIIFIHGIFCTLTIWVYIERIISYKKIDEIHKKAFKPVFKASVCLPIYQIILQIMLVVALYLDY